MKKLATIIPLALLLGFGLGISSKPPVFRPGSLSAREFSPDTLPQTIVREVCSQCHNDQRLRGNLSLETFNVETADTQPEISEKMIRKLRAGMMPPPGVRRPTEANLLDLVEALEARVDARASVLSLIHI